MPTPAQTAIIDGLQDAAGYLNMGVIPKPYSTGIDAYSAVIDIAQAADGGWRASVSTATGLLVSAIVSGPLLAVTYQSAVAAFTISPAASVLIFYEGVKVTGLIANGVNTATTNAALDALNFFFPSELSPQDQAAANALLHPAGAPPKGGLDDLFDRAKEVLGNDDPVCPLVVDLDGDGIELVSLAKSGAYFDLDANGYAQHTGWAKGDDGFLVRDLNGNGRIDNITETFGSNSTSGLAALAAFDTNKDGNITASDSVFSSLRIWKDADGDGYTDAGELLTLAQMGIASVGVVNNASIAAMQ